MSDRATIIEVMARAMDTPAGQEYMPAMREFAARALSALEAARMAVVPVEDVRRMREALDRDIGALLRIYEDAPVDAADVARIKEIATAFGERCWSEAEASKETEG